MSGLARIAHATGAICSGTDQSAGETTRMLQAQGITVEYQQVAAGVPDPCDMLVISAAIGDEHPEVIEAKRRGIQIVKYAQLLGQLMSANQSVAIAGTHGKSSTTAMLAHAMIQTELDPSFIVGAQCDQIGGGARVGDSDILVAEACEYDRSFHNFHPTHSVVLNVEADHLEIYGSLDAVIESFHEFAKRTKPEGSLLIGHDSSHRTAVTADLPCEVETIGYAPQADWFIQTYRPKSCRSLTVSIQHAGEVVCQFPSPMPGEHMAYNAAVAAVTAHRLGAEWYGIGQALADFRGLDRRMQKVGDVDGVTVIDDYGHHPTEIDTTLRALRQFYRPEQNGGRLICVFQPHQHSRTRFLLKEFTTSFSQADQVVIPPIFFVRDSEQDRRAVSAEDLVNRLRDRGVDALHRETFDEIVAHLRDTCRPGDLVVVMGAGPVWKIAQDFINA